MKRNLHLISQRAIIYKLSTLDFETKVVEKNLAFVTRHVLSHEFAYSNKIKECHVTNQQKNLRDEQQEIFTIHKCASIHNAMSELTHHNFVTGEHVDMGRARMQKDHHDLLQLTSWLNIHNPFSRVNSKLRSLVSALISNEKDVLTVMMLKTLEKEFRRKWITKCSQRLRSKEQIKSKP